MTVTLDSFLERYPVFNGIGEEIIESEIEFASSIFLGWNTTYQDKAISLYVAHTLRLEQADSIRLAGGLRSVEEGEEVKIDLIESNQDYFNQTIYGRQLLNLRRQLFNFSMFVV